MFWTQWLREDFWCLLFLFSIVSQELSFQPSKNRNNLTFGLHICQSSKLHSVEGKIIYFIRQTYSWKKATSLWTQIHKQMKIKVSVISTLYSIVLASLQKLCLKHLWTIRIPLTQLTQSIQWLCHLCTLWEKALLPVNTIFCAKSSFFFFNLLSRLQTLKQHKSRMQCASHYLLCKVVVQVSEDP